MYMDATLHWEAMHIQNPAAGGLPGQRSLLFCYRHGARVRKFGYFILSPDHPTTTLFGPPPNSHLATPPPFTSASSTAAAATTTSCYIYSSTSFVLRPARPPPPCSRRTLRVLTPRRMSGVMNFNSFTPRHVGVVGETMGVAGGCRLVGASE